MRCTHCGWNNNDPDTHCIKCGNALEQPAVEMIPCPACTYLMSPKARQCPQCGAAREGMAGAGPAGSAGTVAGAGPDAASPATGQGAGRTGGAETIAGQGVGAVAGVGQAANPSGGKRSFAETIAGKAAPNGGAGSSIGRPFAPTVKGADAEGGPVQEPVVPMPAPTAEAAPGTGGPKDVAGVGPAAGMGVGTIDPYRQPSVPAKEVFLQRLDARDEPPVVLSFSTKEDHIEMNRANLDASNNTITSKVQAELTFSEGRWHIRDCSEKQSTFIQVAESHELKEGDILLIGNKRFIFSTRNPNQ